MGEEEELYNLIHKKTKFPCLQPILSLPLINSDQIRPKWHYKRLKLYRNVNPKIRSTLGFIEDQQSSEIFKPKLPKSFYIIKLKEWAEEIPISGLMPSWESNIINLIPRYLKLKYPRCLEALLQEIKLMYVEEMQEFAVSSIVINDKEDDIEEVEEEETITISMEKPLVTQNNKLFMKNQKHFRANYFLSQSLMKQIIATARQKLTSEIVDFSNYRAMGLLSLSDFQYMISKSIRNSRSIIKHEYYKEIMKRVLSKRHLRRITKEEESRFMRCATNLFVQQILQNMMETITKMLDIIKDVKRCPQLSFELIITDGLENLDNFERNISLSPSIETVCGAYHQVINDISNIVRNDLLCFKYEDGDENHIRVNLPEWFLKESHEKLSEILADLFQPLKDHFSEIVEEFTYVCTSVTRDFIIDLLSNTRDFNLYCDHVKNFNTYLSKGSEMVLYLYYDVGRLSQINAKDNLHRNISGLIKLLMDKMVDYHWHYNRSIFNEFESLKNTALDIPKNAKGLFELSETMSHASTVIVEKLEKKISTSMEMLSELLQLTDLSEKHIEFNKLTINYLFTISDVFIQSNILCEAMKSELEDELQRKINVLNTEVEEIIPEFIIMDNMDDANRVHEYIEFLKLLVSKFKKVDDEIKTINHEEKLFKFPETAFPRVDEIKDVILPFYSLNKMIFLWRRHNSVWLDGPFEYIDSAQVEKITLHYFEEFTELNKTMKTKIKLDMTTPNKPFKFSGIIDDPDPMQQPAPLKLSFQVIQHVKDFKQYIRLVNCMCNPALAERHWTEMSIIYGSDITPNAGTTLRKIIALNLMDNIEKYEVISISANKELALQQQLDDMIEEWNDVVFDIGEDVQDKRLVFVNLESEIQVRLEEHLVKVQEMKGSYFVKPIAEDVDGFHRSLMCVRDTICTWNLLQDEMMIIKPIFEYSKRLILAKSEETSIAEGSEAVEGDEFEVIHDVCEKIEQCLKWVRGEIMQNSTFHGIGRIGSENWEKLKQCLMYIETANEKIYEYLKKMRRVFPRFYFLSDREIVTIMFSDESENYSVDRVVRLLRKCFYGIKNVKLGSSLQIIAIISDYDQEFELASVINPGESNWLINTENSIIDLVKRNIDVKISTIAEDKDSDDFIDNFISDILSVSFVTLKIFWTSQIEACLRDLTRNPSKELNSLLGSQNAFITSVINEMKSENLNKKILRKNQRLILMSLVSVLIHQRDVISLLIIEKVTKIEDFHWAAQLRHYHIDKSIKIEMIYENKNYGFEFNSMIDYPMINTPLTDRIHHTIFQASKHHYFCSLIGPANTGKIETVRNLAIYELGLRFHLINCTKELTCERVSNVIKGIVSVGAWVTFKNIDLVPAPILSALTQKFSQILKLLALENSKKSKFECLDLFGDLSRIKYSGFITVTMTLSPGRISPFYIHKNIPDNLRAIFRPVTVHHPDFEKIIEVKLLSSGFRKTHTISKKINKFYELCSEQLNADRRYLFDLRSLISVVGNSVRLKFQFPEEEDEELIILRSLIDIHLGVLRQDDIPIFFGFVKDVFPGVHMFPPDYSHFLRVFEELSTSDVLQIPESFKLKLIQVLEMLHIKQSFIIVGEALSGKTKCLSILSKCLSLLHSKDDSLGGEVVIETINQKSMRSKNLFGCNEMINTNKRWVDGICTLVLRKFTENKREVNEFYSRKWLIFDGPINGPWMDYLSTILDDHKTLFLDSGEGIKISEGISIIFETEDLKDATPAIISRCGVIHMDSDTVGWRSQVRSWVITHDFDIQSKDHKFMINFLNWALKSALNFISGLPNSFLHVNEVFLVISVLKLMKIYLLDALEINKKEGTSANFNIHFRVWFQAALIQSIIWGMGGILSSDDSKNQLDEFCTSIWNKRPVEISQPDLTLPEGLIQDHNYVFKATGTWKSWTEIMKNSIDFFIDFKFIPTVNTTRLTFIFESHIRHKIPFIICGNRSIGKTTMMHFLLKKKLPKYTDMFLTNIFNLTSRTCPHEAQKYFLLKMNRIIKGRYAPPKDKYSINFVDDLNMITEGDDCDGNSGSTLELVRQLMDHGYWFGCNNNDEKFHKIFVENVMFLSALTLQGNNSNDVSLRLIRHFALYSMSPPSKENIFRIFSTLLLNHLKKNQFSADVSSSVNSMVHATIQIFNLISTNEELRPIPLTDFKYQFNLRDIGRVIKGCSLIHRESAETKVTLIRLWVHESLRVFGDRITNRDHQKWLFSTIKEAINIHFSKESFDSMFDHLPKQNDKLTAESFESLMFCNFIDTGDHKEDSTRRRRYEEITCSKETLHNKLLSYLNQFNEKVEDSKKMDIVIFSDMVTHVIRLCRCLCTPSGNFLMLSMSGGSTGRRILTRLSCFIQKSEFFELSNDSNWRKDLKKAAKFISGNANDCAFFIPCRYLKHEHLMDINCLISTGEIPNLFPADDERQEIIKSARLPAQNGDRNLEIGTIEVMNYFYEQCQEKLHFIIYVNLFDETRCHRHANYRLLKLYPNILNFCLIDCFQDWPQEAFHQLSMKFLQDLTVINSFTKEKVVSASVDVYNHLRLIKSMNNYKTTPSPYGLIHMMKLYSKIITTRHEKIMESRHKYQVGLEKLQYAEQEVSKMKVTLTELKPQLEWSARQTVETMREIETENVIVENARIQVKRDEEIANRAAEIAAILKSECEADLAVAIPILEDAIAALNTLKPADITLVKAMKNPPDTVKLVMAAVCVMLNITSDRVIDPVTGKKSMDYWGPSKRILGEMNFLQILKDYDKDNIPATLMMVVKKTYMTDKSFMPHIVAKASSAAEGLCKWVRAMVSYDEVAKIVAPKKEKLALAEQECNESLDFLNEKRKTLAQLTRKLTALNETLKETLAKKVELESEAKNCTEKLAKSEGLIASLDGEKIKWNRSVDSLKSSLETLAGDLLISSGVIAFLSSFDEIHRREIIDKWKDILQEERISVSKSYDFLISLESKIAVDSWRFSGLSQNGFYAEGCVILKNSTLWCLLVDPQNQANNWIRKMEEKNNLRIFKSSEMRLPHYVEQLKTCMADNCPVLLENLNENFSPSDLDIICQLKSQNDNFETQGFRFYMTTRLHNPSFNPYILKKINVINFHLPEDALHEQLLDIVVSREQPELQAKFNDVIIRSNGNKQILYEEEENILATLSSTSTSVSILEDEKALKMLDTSKKLSVEIILKEEATKEVKRVIDGFRRCYSSFTLFSASLYNTLTSLVALNLMYQFSLTYFIQLFMKSIDISRRSNVIDKRLKYLKRSFTQTLHSSIRNSLLEEHKIIYSFLLCLKMLSSDENLTTDEVDCFFEDLRNINCKSELPDVESNDLNGCSTILFEKLKKLEERFPVFEGIVTSLEDDQISWKTFSIQGDLPSSWASKLSIFQKLLLSVKYLKPDKLLRSLNHFVVSVMTSFDVSPLPPGGLSQSYSESTCLVPLIFILPSYLEPLKMVTEFGKKFGYTSNIFTVSLGGPEDSNIQPLIKSCQREGAWVIIQNCHLADASTMFFLENIYEDKMTGTDALLGFRLWLSSLPSDNLPVGVLQDGIKITSSPPRDLKDSLMICYQTDPLNKMEFFSSCPGKDRVFSMMIYGLCLFHSILRERKKFGRRGWNVIYEFAPADFNISVRHLQNLVQRMDFRGKGSDHFVEGIFHLVARCNYGGRVMDLEDERYLREVLKNFWNGEIGVRRNYVISGEKAGSVRIPDRCEYKDFLKHIDLIQDCDEVLKVFGMDNDVGVGRDLSEVDNFLKSLHLINLIDRDVGKEMNGKLENSLGRNIEIIEEEFLEVIDVHLTEKFLLEYSKPLSHVLLAEVHDFNSKIKKIQNLQNRGSGKLGNLEIFENVTVSELREQFIFLQKWIERGFPEDPIRLRLISSPKKLFSAIKIMFSRECLIDITDISIKTEILASENSQKLINDGKSIYIDGLLISGGRWNEIEKKLEVNNAKEFWNVLPTVRLTPEKIEKRVAQDLNDKFQCPLYKSIKQRDLMGFSGNLENFIDKIQLNSDFSSSFWVKRGTSLFCNIY
ncbi:dynein axonemal heavy chain 7-like [Diachasmimorpha longicaudata]|uniref:dynein axonemal heavy chain 7-like n=1 Tax=Diachasmimorpha longicaudata TaxID=58733 RepID=UPI0030B8E962